jgi:GNAT superfamily N-acetyltransferase
MSAELYIREATIDDRSVIRSLAEQTWPEAYGNIISQEQIRYMLDMIYNNEALLEQMQKGHQFYLAELNAQPIGFASVSEEGTQGCKLNKLYILPTIQKSGAGKALLQEVITYTHKKNHTRLFLQVNKQNPAKDFYTRMGFSIAEEVKLDIGNGFFMDDYIMELKISDCAK